MYMENTNPNQSTIFKWNFSSLSLKLMLYPTYDNHLYLKWNQDLILVGAAQSQCLYSLEM